MGTAIDLRCIDTARSHLPVILHKLDRPQQILQPQITTGSAIEVPDID
ncbi:MAG: hypothetical protein P2A85_05720 [Microcoleus anatoxicus]